MDSLCRWCSGGSGGAAPPLALWGAVHDNGGGRSSKISTINFFLERQARTSDCRGVRIDSTAKDVARRSELEEISEGRFFALIASGLKFL